jgi:hypothetical protein
MSLTDWVRWDGELFDIYFDKPKLDIKGKIKAEPLTKNYSTVGTAFDYVVRLFTFQLNSKWLTPWNDFPIVALNGVNGNQKRRDFIFDFEQKLASLSKNPKDIINLLPDCITLAKLDSVFRSGRDFPDSDIFSIHDDDIKDLTNLFNLLDAKYFISNKKPLLNPTIGKSSQDIGGADVDLVINTCLIDIKTTKYLEFTKEQFRQLMGYYILNLREKSKPLGIIEDLAIYYSRYGLLYVFTPELVAPELFIDITDMEEDSFVIQTKANRSEFWNNIENSIKEYKSPMVD